MSGGDCAKSGCAGMSSKSMTIGSVVDVVDVVAIVEVEDVVVAVVDVDVEVDVELVGVVDVVELLDVVVVVVVEVLVLVDVVLGGGLPPKWRLKLPTTGTSGNVKVSAVKTFVTVTSCTWPLPASVVEGFDSGP